MGKVKNHFHGEIERQATDAQPLPRKPLYFLLMPPSTMEDEGRYRLAWTSGFSNYGAADNKRHELAEQSRGWFRPNDYVIAKEYSS